MKKKIQIYVSNYLCRQWAVFTCSSSIRFLSLLVFLTKCRARRSGNKTREKAHNRFFGNLDTKFSRFLQHKRRKKWTNNRFFLLLLFFSLLFFTDENSLVKFALQHSSTIGRSVVGGCRAIFSLFPLKYWKIQAWRDEKVDDGNFVWCSKHNRSDFGSLFDASLTYPHWSAWYSYDRARYLTWKI